MGVSNLEYDSVKQERDMFREELQQYKMTIENMRMELLVKHLVVANYESKNHKQYIFWWHAVNPELVAFKEINFLLYCIFMHV